MKEILIKGKTYLVDREQIQCTCCGEKKEPRQFTWIMKSEKPCLNSTMCISCKGKTASVISNIRKEYAIPQYGNCQCCGKYAKLNCDHDHTTNEFRGALCIECNTGLGKLGDTEESIDRAKAYLKNSNKNKEIYKIEHTKKETNQNLKKSVMESNAKGLLMFLLNENEYHLATKYFSNMQSEITNAKPQNRKIKNDGQSKTAASALKKQWFEQNAEFIEQVESHHMSISKLPNFLTDDGYKDASKFYGSSLASEIKERGIKVFAKKSGRGREYFISQQDYNSLND